MGRPKKQNGCVGGLTLFTFLIISGFAYFEWSFNWWQSILFGVVAQAMVAGAVNGAIAKAKKRNGTPYRERHPRKLNAPLNASIVTHYLYEAANQLNDGFPLMRVSKDATPSSCPICSRWEGKLISLTNSPDFDGIAHSLRELLDSGIFHEDCIHRLEFVSIGEYPKDVFRKIRDRIGVPGAFGHMSVADIRYLTSINKEAISRAKRKCARQFLKNETFTCAICDIVKPMDELLAIDGYLNASPEDVSLICTACEKAANKKGKTYITHAIFKNRK